MDAITLDSRSKEKTELKIKAAKLTETLKATGIKQGVLATRIDVSQNTLSRFMKGDDLYVTRSLVARVKKYVEDNNY